MKSLGHSFILVLIFIVFLTPLPTATAQSIYIDPLNGDDRNPGITPTAPLKSPRPSRLLGNDRLIRVRSASPQQEHPAVSTRAALAPALAESQLERIILGTKIVTEWEAFSTTIWQAPLPLQWQENWRLTGITVDGTGLQPGCAADFIENGQYYSHQDMLYINDAAGNPDVVGKTVTVFIHDDLTGADIERLVTGWSSTTPTVWQVGFPTTPIHVAVNEILLDPHWWYGPLPCMEDTGQAGHLYLRDPDGNPDITRKTTAAIVDTGGWAVSSGDFNGDGLKDVVHSNAGPQIYINYGAPEFSASQPQILTSPDDEAFFGSYVASAGDVNNDRFDDLLVAMDWGVGKVYLYMGSESGLDHNRRQVLEPPAPRFAANGYGHGIAGNGDINGDGYSDILIMGGDGSHSYLFVYMGSGSGINTNPDSVIAFAGKMNGGTVCIVGDMDGNGYDEVALSMPTIVSDAHPVDTIEILVYKGSASGELSHPSILSLSIPEKDSAVYGVVAPAGDVNHDGLADLVIGNQWAGDSPNGNEGKAYLVLGTTSGMPETPDFTIDNPIPEPNVRFGSAVSGIGDFDRDGYDDIAVGCPDGQGTNGFVVIYSGSDEGISNTATRTITGVNNFGWSVSGVGDIKDIGQIYLAAGEEFGGSYLYAAPCDTLYYADGDQDGYGDPGQTTMACVPPAGYVSDNLDCNDAGAEIHPDAVEACNGLDDNCDGRTDEECPLPIADAGVDQEAVEGAIVKLDGSASAPADSERPIIAYSWTQTSGPAVTLADSTAVTPAFLTPPVGTEGAVLVFQLMVEDSIGLTAAAEVTVSIHDNGITGFPADVLTFICATGQPVGIKVQGGASLLSIVPIDSSSVPPANNTPDAMIYGLFDITVRVPSSGATAEVLFYFPSPADQNHMWCRYNSDEGWMDYHENSAFDGDRKAITIRLTDGGAGDDDRSANGTLGNVSGLGVYTVGPASGDTEPGNGGGGGGGGCFIAEMLEIVF